MKIALFLSGHVRTLFLKFHKNIEIIKNSIKDCEIDVYYSFWDDLSTSNKINDPWHIKIHNTNEVQLEKQFIDKYFLEIGVNYCDGEIESLEAMNEVLLKTPFLPESNGNNNLSSQYYKNNRVVEKYMKDGYDICVKIRPDITINNFLNKKQLLDIIQNNILVVNTFYWYNGLYTGKECNEMIWVSNSIIFRETTKLFLHQEKVSKQLDYHFGELVSGTYFNNLLKDNKIGAIASFDFDYRVIR